MLLTSKLEPVYALPSSNNITNVEPPAIFKITPGSVRELFAPNLPDLISPVTFNVEPIFVAPDTLNELLIAVAPSTVNVLPTVAIPAISV